MNKPHHHYINIFIFNLCLMGAFALLLRYQLPAMHQICAHPAARTIIAASGMTLVVDIIIAVFRRKAWTKPLLLSGIAVILVGSIAYWLGSYKYSPASLYSGKYSIFQGFLVTRLGRIEESVNPDETLILQYGSNAGISAIADLPGMSCHWTSQNHAALDSPDQCDIVYSPPAAEYDILTVRVGSSCGIQPLRSQIKISIYP